MLSMRAGYVTCAAVVNADIMLIIFLPTSLKKQIRPGFQMRYVRRFE